MELVSGCRSRGLRLGRKREGWRWRRSLTWPLNLHPPALERPSPDPPLSHGAELHRAEDGGQAQGWSVEVTLSLGLRKQEARYPKLLRLCTHLTNQVLCCAKWLQLCPTLCDSMDCSPPGSSVHGILQARILEWVAISSSRGTSRYRDQTPVSYIGPRNNTKDDGPRTQGWKSETVPRGWLRETQMCAHTSP